jgi:hypothetical protein
MLKKVRHRRRVGGTSTKTKDQETEMFNFDRFAQVATAAVGALVLSTVSIAAAIGPVHAADAGRTQVASVQLEAAANG